MVTVYERNLNYMGVMGITYTEYKGLKNDPRPLEPNEGDIFQELDTGTTYEFMDGEWVFIPSYLPTSLTDGNDPSSDDTGGGK